MSTVQIRPPAALLACLLATGCGEIPLLEELSPDQSCRNTIAVGPLGVPLKTVESGDTIVSAGRAEGAVAPEAAGLDDEAAEAVAGAAAGRIEVEWLVPRSSAQQSRLNAWCAAVGPAVFGGWADPPAAGVDSLVVVSWNVHVGGGDLQRLVRDLREGAFTGGGPVEHFVLLIQEAHREDDTVPAFEPSFPLGGGVYAAPPGRPRRDIVEEARELRLSLLYVPSMRNGEGKGEESPEDRGNAILSTLPLTDPMALELPVARQRRVAVAARVITGPGDAVRPLVASVHLENDATGWTRDEQARLEQTEALLDGLPEDELAVAAGDFNTWSRGPDEALVPAMLQAFPDTPPFPAGHTYVRAYGLVRRQLDYVFVRLPEGGRAEVVRVPDPYNSDHLPIISPIVLPDD